jgi:hypothetical protein
MQERLEKPHNFAGKPDNFGGNSRTIFREKSYTIYAGKSNSFGGKFDTESQSKQVFLP